MACVSRGGGNVRSVTFSLIPLYSTIRKSRETEKRFTKNGKAERKKETAKQSLQGNVNENEIIKYRT